jgi:hypothetical protein
MPKLEEDDVLDTGPLPDIKSPKSPSAITMPATKMPSITPPTINPATIQTTQTTATTGLGGITNATTTTTTTTNLPTSGSPAFGSSTSGSFGASSTGFGSAPLGGNTASSFGGGSFGSTSPTTITTPANNQPIDTSAFKGAIEASAGQEPEHWMKAYWRPAMGWLYMLTCFMDFVGFPVLWSMLQAYDHGAVTQQWNPITLQGAGLYHLAMGGILGIAAYGRTKEKMGSAN